MYKKQDINLPRLLFIVSEDWYFVSHRLHLAKTAREAGYEVALLSRISKYRERIETSGVKVFDWSLSRRSCNPLKEYRSVFQIFWTIKKYQPCIVHAVALKPVLYTSLICKFTGMRNRVSALGGLGFIFSSNKISARLLRLLLIIGLRVSLDGEFSRLILQNQDDKKIILKSKIIKFEHIRLVRGSGVDTVEFSPRAETNEIPLVILPARLLWDKGVGDFVDCAKIITQKGIKVRFALVGERDEHNPKCISASQLKAWIDEGVVEWWGRREDMSDVYRQATVVCLPSHREGLPKVLLEAASSGRPIVTYDVPGCREVVINEENGFLVPFRDINCLAFALEKLIVAPALREQMGKNGRRKVLKEFSQEKIAAETLTIWNEVLA